MERKIVVPDGMLKAGCNTGWPSKREEVEAILEAALRWLSENPIVPTEEQADELWHHPKVLSGDEHYAKAMARDWQRRMFLAPEPEVPEEIKDLIWHQESEPLPEVRFKVDHHNRTILESYRRGQEAGKS